MTPEQMMGYTLLQTTALTAIASTRIYHGMRPVGTTVPCINFYRLPGGIRASGMETTIFTVNCRATTAATALTMARHVVDLFHGSSSRGTNGNINSFEITRAGLLRDGGLVMETEDNLYNAPVDIQVVYPTSSVT